MRITSLMIQMNLKSGLSGRLAALAKASTQAATGHRIQTVSDDPVSATQIMRMQSQVADMTQYQRNGTFATTKLSTEDVAISSLLNNLASARKLALTAMSADPADPSRQAALENAKQLREQMIALGNTRVGDQYIFGGDQTTTPPFTATGTYVGTANVMSITINDNVSTPVNHSGQPLFTDALSAVNDLITQLTSGSPDQIAASAGQLDAATRTAHGIQSEVGARLDDIRQQATQLASQRATLLDRRDALMNVDPAQAIIEMQQQQAALEQAYAVVGRVLQSTLTDYLR